MTSNLASRIAEAISVIPPQHRLPPTEGEVLPSKEAGRTRLQDYAFTEGFSVVTYSGSATRIRLKCNRHGKGTRNTRKITEEGRKRVNTKVNDHQCPYEVYVSK